MGKSKFGGTFTGNKVPRLTKWLYPLTGIFRDACYALVGSFLLQYAINTGVLSPDEKTFKAQFTVITVAMVIALIWDGFNDPIMGFIVEKVHFKLGKFKPWILIGAVGNALAVVCMFLIRPTTASGEPNGWAFVGCMIAFYFLWDLFFTMNDIGYWAMLPSLTSDEKERASLTSRVTVCASIGGFLMTAAGFLLPTMFVDQGLSSGMMFGIMAIVISILFLASQAAVFFFCKERARDEAVEQASEAAGFLDLFKVIIKNPQLRKTVIAMFLYYLASGVLTGGIGLNYFYLALGYGSGRGGLVSTIISVMYVGGQVLSQALYPVLAKKMKKQTLLTTAFVVQIVGYLGFLICCFPLFGGKPLALSSAATPEMNSMDLGWAFGGTMFLYYLFPFIFFAGQGLMYMVILVMFQNSIDYHEYKFGERKESVISSWRPLDVKLSSALLRLFQWVIFTVAGVYGVISKISDLEGKYNAKLNAAGDNKTAQTAATEWFKGEIDALKVENKSLIIIGILIIIILVVSMTAAYLLLHFGYKIDEDESRRIVAELEERHKASGEATPVAEEAEPQQAEA